MIKARGGNVVLLGLSRMNVDRLMNDLPIRFDGAAVGLPGLVFVICGGETEKAIQDELVKMGVVDDNTRITDRSGGGSS